MNVNRILKGQEFKLDEYLYRQLMKRIILIRHGKTQYNIDGRLQGTTDTHLTEESKLDVRKDAEQLLLQNMQAAAIISSTMFRAGETTDEYTKALSIFNRVNLDELREFSFGNWEGSKIADLKTNQDHEDWIRRPCSISEERRVPPNGEQFLPFLFRVNSALVKVADILKTTSENQKVLVVSHATVNRGMRWLTEAALSGVQTMNSDTARQLEPRFFYDPDGEFIKIPHQPMHIDLQDYRFKSIL